MAETSKSHNSAGRKPLTRERLKELLYYDPIVGVFIWKEDRLAGEHRSVIVARKGERAGTIKKSSENLIYRKLTIDGRSYRAARIAFLYMVGIMPKRVDHKDGDGMNDKWGNLRPCSQSQNMGNTRRRSNNTSGVKGVHWYKSRKRWHVQLRYEGKRYHVGYFDNKDDAAKAYETKATEIFGEFARTA